jgi:thiamine biosynthesis lipoprotein
MTAMLWSTVLVASVASAGEEPVVLRLTRRVMGTEFQVIVWGQPDDRRDRTRTELQAAAEGALDEAERLDGRLSLYVESSDVCWINRHADGDAVRVEPELFRLLQVAARVHRDTDGAFDVTVGPLMECWGFFRGQGQLPGHEAIQEALGRVGMQHVLLDEQRGTVRFEQPGMTIDLGGIGKGYAVERMADMLRRLGVRGALIHGGLSTIYALGTPPDAQAWTVGIQDPYDADRRLTTLKLRDQALSTSGSYEKLFEVDGHIYSHILDPRTGRPAEGLLGASAITGSPTEADALSTAFFVMGMEGTRGYCAKHPGVRAILVPMPGAGEKPRATFVGAQS